MVLLKRKPVIYTPLPSLSTIIQPLSAPQPEAEPAPKKSKKNAPPPEEPAATELPIPEGENDEEQVDRLITILHGSYSAGPGIGKGKGKGGSNKLLGTVSTSELQKLVIKANGVKEEANGHDDPAWRVWDRECFYIPETGEIFTDYEAFYDLPLFQCEVSGKSSLSFANALASEQREVRQLHTRFPSQLKKAVLTACQFQIEGKLDVLADKIFERFVNRFFDDEKVFVDVQGDKYLAKIVKTFPPRSLAASTSTSPLKPTSRNVPLHPFATDLSLDIEEVVEKDDPMKYFYNVRLIEEGAQEGEVQEYGSDQVEEGDPKWGGSTMEVQADKISRDRINFSRAMLKRFIRDCVQRDAAVYSPWTVKPSVAARYGIPTEMSEEVRLGIQRYRERQMDKRKRERDERMGIVEEEEPKKKKKGKVKEEEEVVEVKKKPLKIPAEDLLVEYEERDSVAGRVAVRPTPTRTMPFGDVFETFLMAWSFLNVMGKPLRLSPFSLDDFEQSLYHNSANPAPLLAEIHACLINALILDLKAGHEPVKPLRQSGLTEKSNDTDYWEGKKGATTETLSPVAEPLASSWTLRELYARESRRGWEQALIGLLWERATLDTLPSYLDNILHLTFEDKPAPTRPTWSTAPATSTGPNGLIPAKPEKRYPTLHHLDKLAIISFLVELVAQTAAVRDFLDESVAALTEVRKEQIDVKRDWKRVIAERDALEPKEEPESNGDEPNEVNGDAVPEVNGDGDVSMAPSNHSSNAELDELEDSPPPSDDESDDALSSVPSEKAGASRRKAMAANAAQRQEEEAARKSALAKERELAKEKKAENKQLASEKKRLQDEEDAAIKRLHELEHEFRSHMYTLRARPFGYDRFGNKVWWMDGLGSAPLYGEGGRVMVGTGRLYLQGSDEHEVEWVRQGAMSFYATHQEEELDLPLETVMARKEKDEAEGRLDAGEWASYDTPEQLEVFMSYLNPRGIREAHLLKHLKQWLPELEAGMRRRRIVMGLDVAAEDEGRRTRRKAADDEADGHMAYKNKRAG